MIKIKLNYLLGFSLIEVLVALFLSGLLMLALIKFFFIFQSNLELIHRLQDEGDRGRTAFFIFSNDLRMAGYRICLNNQERITPIQGFSDKNVPSYFSIKAKKNTDILMISSCIKINGRSKFAKTAYFIADSYRFNSDKKPIFSLFEKRLPGKRRELIANVNNLKLKYEKNNGHFYASNSINNWQNIHAVEVILAIGSESKMNWSFFVGLRNVFQH